MSVETRGPAQASQASGSPESFRVACLLPPNVMAPPPAALARTCRAGRAALGVLGDRAVHATDLCDLIQSIHRSIAPHSSLPISLHQPGACIRPQRTMRATAALLLLAGPAMAGAYRPPPSLELLDLRGQVSFNPTPVKSSLVSTSAFTPFLQL